MFNQIHTLKTSVQSLEDTSSAINTKMMHTSQYLHSVMMQVNDANVRLENTSAVLRVNISRCESMLKNLSAITKETDMKLNLRYGILLLITLCVSVFPYKNETISLITFIDCELNMIIADELYFKCSNNIYCDRCHSV